MTDTAAAREEELRGAITTVAAECDRRFNTDVLATMLQGAPLTELLENDLVRVLDDLIAEYERHRAVERATDL